MASPLSEQSFLDELRAALHSQAPQASRSPRFAVAFSGGLDSTVLLVAMTRLSLDAPLRALHIDHGLHADSAAWERHCRGVAAALHVPYRSLRVTVDTGAGSGLEAAARAARYAALCELLEEGETLLTAHHADDQLETVLLRMLRGSGVRGLRGILPHASLDSHLLMRPMLGVSRADVRARAGDWELRWLEDPSNRDIHHDRNYLRASVLPDIRARWSAAARSARRLAAAMADAEEILASTAEHDLAAGGAVAHCIPQAALLELSEARQRNALRHAIRAAGLSLPTARQLEEVRSAVGVTRADANTKVQWPGGEARLYRGRLYLIEPRVRVVRRLAGFDDVDPAVPGRTNEAPRDTLPSDPAAAPSRLRPDQPWSGAQGHLTLEPAELSAERADAGTFGNDELPDAWAREGLEVRFRKGGERFKPAGDAHTRSLKHWFQEHGILPWMRGCVPLLYRGDRLVAVADLVVAQSAVDVRAQEADSRPGWRIRWSGHAPIR